MRWHADTWEVSRIGDCKTRLATCANQGCKLWEGRLLRHALRLHLSLKKLKVAGGYHSSRRMVCRWAARFFAIFLEVEQVMHQQFLRIWLFLLFTHIHTIDWLNSYVSLISQSSSRRSHIIIIHWKSHVQWNWTIEFPWFFPTFQQDPPKVFAQTSPCPRLAAPERLDEVVNNLVNDVRLGKAALFGKRKYVFHGQ